MAFYPDQIASSEANISGSAFFSQKGIEFRKSQAHSALLNYNNGEYVNHFHSDGLSHTWSMELSICIFRGCT